MPVVRVNGGDVVYELLGGAAVAADPVIVLTPGGRFGKEIPGLRPLAEALVAGGQRVLLWDRPNCGASEVQFYGQSESHMRAETLRGLLTALDVGRCVLAGGSGGARDSMLTVMLYPELATKLIVWNIVGGTYGTFNLGAFYVIPTINALRAKGIEGVLELPEWKALVEAKPSNGERFRSFGAEQLQSVMLRWLNAYVPKPGQTIPGVEDELFSRIRVPTLIIRGGEHDLSHPKRTSLEVSCLIEGSTLIDPPWPEDAWEGANRERASGQADQYNMFATWVLAAPAILDFVAQPGSRSR
jgi:pimeloyl-ACP methyl ester carboxylesterase